MIAFNRLLLIVSILSFSMLDLGAQYQPNSGVASVQPANRVVRMPLIRDGLWTVGGVACLNCAKNAIPAFVAQLRDWAQGRISFDSPGKIGLGIAFLSSCGCYCLKGTRCGHLAKKIISSGASWLWSKCRRH